MAIKTAIKMIYYPDFLFTFLNIVKRKKKENFAAFSKKRMIDM